MTSSTLEEPNRSAAPVVTSLSAAKRASGLHTLSQWFAAEFFIVVTGVLAALGAAAWTESRNERRRETIYLTQLVTDLAADSTRFANLKAEVFERKLNALATTAPVVHRGAAVPRDTFAFLTAIGVGGVWGVTPHFEVTRTTYEELLGTGNLRLIRTASLRTAIVRYYSGEMVEQVRIDRRRSGYVMFVHGMYPAELRARLTMEDLRAYDLSRILRLVRSDEFKMLHLQEMNLALFMRDMLPREAERRNTLLKEVRTELAAR